MTDPNDNAYSLLVDRSSSNEENIVHYGFTKREIVFKDFMCAIIQKHGYFNEYAGIYASQAEILTEAYFKKLNKQ